MASENKTHWKNNFDYRFIGSYSFQEGQEITLTIKSVDKDIVKNQTGQEEDCTIAVFKEAVNGEKKPMILNKTNCGIIEKLYNTPYIEDWVGKKIIVYVDNNIKAFGDTVDGLRIKQIVPVINKPKLTPDSKKWELVKERVKEGVTYEEITKHYAITKADFKLLQK